MKESFYARKSYFVIENSIILSFSKMARHMHPWRTGKNLFDILSQLPNFGVGRIVTRGRWEYEFPNEPCYYRITRVKVDCTRPNLDSGEAWGKPTMRGYSREGNNEALIGSAWKREWKLIRKSEEEDFCAFTPKETDFHPVPTHAKVPPLLAEMMKQERAQMGENVEDEGPLMMKLKVSQGYRSRAYQMQDDIIVGDDSVEIDV